MLELWGGIECTVNRIGTSYHDQIARAGHPGRLSDIDRLADLGIRRLRYPLLWERIQPDQQIAPDWSALAPHMARLRERAVAPIAGLVHHGSGPRDANVLDPAFPARLAAYARRVAIQYPWVDMWTPVNEPVSTARFSGLYGLWHPHHQADTSFVRILLHECRGIVEAMEAIREIIPDAQYFHTDDMGAITATPTLAYQAAFENERQLLALDLLAGRVTRAHPLFNYLRRFGATSRELEWFGEHAMLPDVVAADYYPTSDRHLDERCSHYPDTVIGGNHRHRYVDIATSTLPGWSPGFDALIQRLWMRYHRPIAIGELHRGGSRETQLRWLRAGWDAATRASETSAVVRAVTCWALLGTFDWNDLCRSERGYYESGAFDIRSGTPRPTALAAAITSLAQSGSFHHPAAAASHTPSSVYSATAATAFGSTIMIVGARGTLGRALAARCRERKLAFVNLSRDELDIVESLQVADAIERVKPWAVINASGYVDVAMAEREPERCRSVNVTGALNLAVACERFGSQLVSFSSDLVFDGAADRPYLESDQPAPVGVYGRSKFESEVGVLEAFPDALVVRTSAFFGSDDDANFVVQTLRRLRSRTPSGASAAIVSPTHVDSLADAVLDLVIDGADGIWHLASPASISWYDWARKIAELARLDTSLVFEADAVAPHLIGRRPSYTALGTERGLLLPSFDESLERCVGTLQDRMMAS